MQFKNYYAILGLVPEAEKEVIKAAYRALAMLHHPDRNHENPLAAEKMAEVNEAYAVLSNDEERKRYDLEYKAILGASEKWSINDMADAELAINEVIQKDWETALNYFPDLALMAEELHKLSPQLANVFRLTLLESKQYENRKQLATQFENEYLSSYFGKSIQLQKFAKELICSGYLNAARALNEVVRVIGVSADDEEVIRRICREFDFETKAQKAENEQQRLRGQAAAIERKRKEEERNRLEEFRRERNKRSQERVARTAEVLGKTSVGLLIFGRRLVIAIVIGIILGAILAFVAG